jgi:hypothetical protein
MLFLGEFTNSSCISQAEKKPNKKKVIIAKLLLILQVLGASLYLDDQGGTTWPSFFALA